LEKRILSLDSNGKPAESTTATTRIAKTTLRK
jgi:hypothetical protein